MTPERRAWCWLIAGAVVCAVIGAATAVHVERILRP